jgi:uncharacterized protein with gpF-like domain
MARRRTKPPLTNKRQKWAEQRGGATFKGESIGYPVSVALRYEADILKLVRRMERAYTKELKAIFNELDYELAMDASIASQSRIKLAALEREFVRVFDKEGKAAIDRMLGRVDKVATAKIKSSLKELSGGLTLTPQNLSPQMEEAVKAATAENVSLIKSIAQNYHLQIEGAVMRSIQPSGGGLAAVVEQLSKYEGITHRRVKNIALDQTRKLTTSHTVARASAAGVTHGEWIHSGGGSDKRPKHVAFSGKIFELADPPAIGDSGNKVLPGTDVNCKCRWRPVIVF